MDFRMQTDRNAEGWDEAHDLISGLLHDEVDGAPAALLDAIREAEELDVAQRRPVISEPLLFTATRAFRPAHRDTDHCPAPRSAHT